MAERTYINESHRKYEEACMREVDKGQSLKEAIGRRVALLPGTIRYVYVGSQPLEDFRVVTVDMATGITEGNVDSAISILS